MRLFLYNFSGYLLENPPDIFIANGNQYKCCCCYCCCCCCCCCCSSSSSSSSSSRQITFWFLSTGRGSTNNCLQIDEQYENYLGFRQFYSMTHSLISTRKHQIHTDTMQHSHCTPWGKCNLPVSVEDKSQFCSWRGDISKRPTCRGISARQATYHSSKQD